MRKVEWKWEDLDECTKRAKVIGGWLVKSIASIKNNNLSVVMCFVADSDHQWVITAPFNPSDLGKVNSNKAKPEDFESPKS